MGLRFFKTVLFLCLSVLLAVFSQSNEYTCIENWDTDFLSAVDPTISSITQLSKAFNKAVYEGTLVILPVLEEGVSKIEAHGWNVVALWKDKVQSAETILANATVREIARLINASTDLVVTRGSEYVAKVSRGLSSGIRQLSSNLSSLLENLVVSTLDRFELELETTESLDRVISSLTNSGLLQMIGILLVILVVVVMIFLVVAICALMVWCCCSLDRSDPSAAKSRCWDCWRAPGAGGFSMEEDEKRILED